MSANLRRNVSRQAVTDERCLSFKQSRTRHTFRTGEVAAAAELGDDAINGIVLMAQADFDGDPDKRPAYRRAAQALWDPYRVNLGV